jgi:branched-chain amino acid transport system substrate-binding protein
MSFVRSNGYVPPVLKFSLLLTLLLCLAVAAPAAAQDKTIYSSLPLQGDARPQSQDIVRAMAMALEESGRTDVKYVSLDDSTAATGHWEPGQVSSNARKAVGDPSTVAYLGEFNSGASAISIPFLNEAEILQISPSNTYVGLTRSLGAEPREPEKYYPTGRRSYGRVVPADHTQAHALLAYARERGRKRIVLVHDREVYGKSLADMIRANAGAYGITVARVLRLNARRRGSFTTIARSVRRANADAMMFAGITQTGAAQLWRSVHARNRRIDLFGPDGVAESAFTEKVPRTARARTFITNPTLDPAAYPPAAQEFYARFRAKHGKDPEPYAIYGYEAMALALDALARGGNTRSGAIGAFFATRDRPSVLGTYSIDENGDTTVTDYGSYTIENGALKFDKTIKAEAA